MKRYARCAIIVGFVLMLACLLISTSLTSAGRPFRREVPGLGTIEHRPNDEGTGSLRLLRSDGVRITIEYKKGKAVAKIVSYPRGHHLNDKSPPLTEGRTLHQATVQLPTILAIADGTQQKIDKERLRFLEPFPVESYDVRFKRTPERPVLRLSNGLLLKGDKFKPYARMPYVAYWGPSGIDGLGDDLLYTGYVALDKHCQRMPLEMNNGCLHYVKVGDTVEFDECKIKIEHIDHDNDRDPKNNVMQISLSGLTDVSKIKADGAGKPVSLREFADYVCLNHGLRRDFTPKNTTPVPITTIKTQVQAFANARTNTCRRNVAKDILEAAGYSRDTIQSVKNGFGDSEDVWVSLKGTSNELAIIAAHYDKAGVGQGVIDNASGAVILGCVASALRHRTNRLGYVFLLYGAEEVGNNWDRWVSMQSDLRSPIAYAINIEGGGLVGAEYTFTLDQVFLPGWLNWRFPLLRVNETGGHEAYLKHTGTDNVNMCDFSRLMQLQKTLLDAIRMIDANYSVSATNRQ